jgi:hypothetical protein
LIQFQTNHVLLTYLLALTVNDNASYEVKAIATQAVNDLKKYTQALQKISKDTEQQAHFALALKRIEAPEKAKPTIHAAIPPGAPIGCDW